MPLATEIQFTVSFEIAPAIGLMSTAYSEDIHNQQLADACNMSEAHFRRQFKHCTGHSPHQYLNSIRIHMACGLLKQDDYSILQIALECGFPTLSTFNRQFIHQMKMTPREHRQRN